MTPEKLRLKLEGQGKTFCHLLTKDGAGHFTDLETGHSLDSAIQLYSRMKFGDVEAIESWSKAMATTFVAQLEAKGSLYQMFQSAGQKGEHVFLTAPGVRNVISASNRLLWEVGQRVNVWLSQAGLPTMVCRQVARLGSGRSNYAQLSAAERKGRNKSTQSLIPRSDYEDFPIHVVFLDDVEVTGSTAERAQRKSLAGGAKSFHSVFALQVEPELAKASSGIEHELNHFLVSEKLDGVLASILAHPGYQPVQRTLRLLFHPRNQSDLVLFASTIPEVNLMRIYTGAMSNDYLHIAPDAETGIPLYRESLLILQGFLKGLGRVSEAGLPL